LGTKASVNCKKRTAFSAVLLSVTLILVFLILAAYRWGESGSAAKISGRAANTAGIALNGVESSTAGTETTGTETTGAGTTGTASTAAWSLRAGAGTLPADANPLQPPALVPETVPFTSPEKLCAMPAASDGGACYRVAEGMLDGVFQKVHVLTADPSSDAVAVRPVLSFDRLFGYEALKDMDARLDALASVNGGFGPPDGRPGGAAMIDGVFLSPADARFPVLVIGGRQASLSALRTGIVLMTGRKKLAADFLNPWPMMPGVAVYTPAFGTTDRLEAEHLAIVVTKGLVTRSVTGEEPVAIPPDGFLAVAVGKEQIARLQGLLSVGTETSWQTNTLPEIPDGTTHLMACGGLLVHEGKAVEPESDPWAGSLKAPAPRSAVGIGREGQLVFFVAEGRIKGGASGFSGKALSRFLADMGLAEAALLDGGASSEMIVGHEIVNNLSAGRERKLPSGYALVLRQDPDEGR
jgi:hypothetical protein